MRNLKFMFVALVLAMSTSMYANADRSTNHPENLKRTSVSYEIEKLLRNSSLVIEEDFTVTVIFMVTQDKKIDVRSISSPNEEVNKFLEMRLQDHKLKGKGWLAEKLYELPIQVKAKK
ncbi:hypothetical protein [Salinimicrobium gaetbulicola]|uniref:TonB-like protein n=1 Tax=Salinimicrobium gaetbulicola TaxID=999702 RepID=A0ABW3IDK8_9FLAO